ncbi:MAG: hypothetical protein ACK5OX_17440 [Desertimonas sp.]
MYHQLGLTEELESTGARRALRVVIASTACDVRDADPRNVLVELESDEDVLVLEVFVTSRPGHLVAVTGSGEIRPRWELPIRDGHAVQIVANVERAPADHLAISVTASPDEQESLRRGVADGTDRHLLILPATNQRPITVVDAPLLPPP